MRQQAILLPGIVLPKELAYGALRDALGEGIDARAKDLEVYATDEPPAGYGQEMEIADDSGFEHFHLVGYSGGGRSRPRSSHATPIGSSVSPCSSPPGSATRA
jgi:hypothetical protein